MYAHLDIQIRGAINLFHISNLDLPCSLFPYILLTM